MPIKKKDTDQHRPVQPIDARKNGRLIYSVVPILRQDLDKEIARAAELVEKRKPA